MMVPVMYMMDMDDSIQPSCRLDKCKTCIKTNDEVARYTNKTP